jgi:hypothetical protein
LPRDRLADVGFLYNGSFEFATTGVGFDWRPTGARERDAGYTVEMPPAAGVSGKRALRVSYNGKRQSGIPTLQYVALSPVRYARPGLAPVSYGHVVPSSARTPRLAPSRRVHDTTDHNRRRSRGR